MASFWSLFSYRWKIGHRDKPDPHVVHLYFISHNGLSSYYLYGTGLLDEYEEIYEGGKTKPLVLFIILFALTVITGKTLFTLRRVVACACKVLL
jgi:hypothetical protein